MSRELRLRATGERLVWWHCAEFDGGYYLSRESKVGRTTGWFAGVTNDGGGCYDTDQWCEGTLLASIDGPVDVADTKKLYEETLVDFEVAYVLNVEDDDGAFPSD